MSDKLNRKVFLYLRALGPISNADLAARLEVPTTTTYACPAKAFGPLGHNLVRPDLVYRWEVKNQKRKAVING